MENNYEYENGIGEGVFEMDKDEMEKYEEEAMKDYYEQVDGLFGKNRVNTIHELKMIGSKDLSR